MPAIRASVILHTTNADPADYITNNFCFMGANPEEDMDALTQKLREFYMDIGMSYFSNTIDNEGHQVKYYDLPGVKPNYPLQEDTFDFIIAPSGTPLPSELSVCLSFQGSKASGFPQARRRGRIYVGPLSVGSNVNGRPDPSLIGAIAAAGNALRTDVAAIAGDTRWAIWSVRNQAPVEVTDGWVDNAFDIQRRRGVRDTSRTTW